METDGITYVSRVYRAAWQAHCLRGGNGQLAKAMRLALAVSTLGLSPLSTAVAGQPDFTANYFGIGDQELDYVAAVDVDADGDTDLLTGKREQDTRNLDVRLYENLGTSRFPVFADPTSFANIDTDEYLPTFVDIDADRDPDLFLPLFFDGVLKLGYRENTGRVGSPEFANAVPNPFGISIERSADRLTPAEFVDLDADGDLDVLFVVTAEDRDGDPYYAYAFSFFENTGSAASPAFTQRDPGELGLYVYGFSGSIQHGDMEGDGDPDLFTEFGEIWENTGSPQTPQFVQLSVYVSWDQNCIDYADLDADRDADAFCLTFQDQARRLSYRENLTDSDSLRFIGEAGAVVPNGGPLGDVDGDGDLDILTSWFDYYENFGGPHSPVFRSEPVFAPFGLAEGGMGYTNHGFADFDADGDLDLLVEMYGNEAEDVGTGYVENTGSSTAPWLASDPKKFVSIVGPAAAGDLDGDKDSDLVTYDYVDLWYSQNVGSPTQPRYTSVTKNSMGLHCTESCNPSQFVDLDLDGDLDLAGATVLENQGTAEHAAFAAATWDSWIPKFAFFGDLDADGDADALSWDGLLYTNKDRSPGTLLGYSSRAYVGAGADLLTSGFIIEGDTPKTVVIRGLGPYMEGRGVTDTLQDPTLVVFSGADPIASNDNWEDRPEKTLIVDAGLAPQDPREAALMIRLDPGAYTVHLRGKDGGEGVGQIAVAESPYDYGRSRIARLSGRALVLTDQERTMAGFQIQGDTPVTVVVRGLGPYMADRGVPGVLPDPEIFLIANGEPIAHNNDWRDGTDADGIEQAGLAPVYDQEAALMVRLEPGTYNVLLQGRDGGTGVGQIAIDAL